MGKKSSYPAHCVFISLCLSSGGLVLGQLFGLTLTGILLAGAGCLLMVYVFFLAGAFSFLKMASARVKLLPDSKKAKIKLSFGCLSRSWVVPVKTIREDKAPDDDGM